ncbi:MAG: alpha/beta hydrolase [Alphaproteobacteria bacterium]
MKHYGLVVLGFLASCAQLDVAAVNLPTHFDSIHNINDITYNLQTKQKLDLYLPPTHEEKTLPVVVFLHGGRWQAGSKDDYPFVGSALAKKGYITVIPDYRKYPDVQFPAYVDDAAAALVWVQKHIKEYGGNPHLIHVMGHSAGAHIGALAVTDPRYLKKYGKPRSLVKTFVGLAGPYDFIPDEPDLIAMFGPPSRYASMQVTTFVDGKEPPMLLLWGRDDTAVKKSNMDKLATRIHRMRGCVKTKIYSETDHIWIIANLSWLGSSDSSLLNDIVGFMQNPICE